MASETGTDGDQKKNHFPYHDFIKEYNNPQPGDKRTTEDKIAQLYDKWDTYEKDLETVSYNGPKKGAALFAELCPDKNSSILDCGAGSGLSGEGLVAEGYKNIHALDISQKLLDIAKARGIYKSIVCSDAGNANKVSYKDDEFDALYSVGCVSPFGMHPVAIKEWVRIVKPGGIILFLGRHRYWQPNDGKHETEFREEFKKVVEDLETSKKAELLLRKVIPDYVESTEGLAFAFKVL